MVSVLWLKLRALPENWYLNKLIKVLNLINFNISAGRKMKPQKGLKNSEKDDSTEGNYPGKKYVEIGPYLGLGVQLAASIVLMFFLGYWLDGKLGTSPILTIIFSFLGGSAGIYSVIKTVLELNRKNKSEKGS